MHQEKLVVEGGIASCELRFRPNVHLVSVVRRFVTAFYEKVVDDVEVLDRVALATHELLENAVKYAMGPETTVRIEVDLVQEPPAVCVRTWNRTSPEHRDVLALRFKRLLAAQDVAALYQELMVEASTRTTGSGLGIARIRAEADMNLACEIEGDQVCIIARTEAPQAVGG
jgi:hypothetical protein